MLLAGAFLALLLGAVLSLVFGRDALTRARLGVAGAVTASLLGLAACLPPLISAGAVVYHVAWSVPRGSFTLVLDPLAAFFLLITFLLTPLTAWYGGRYLREQAHAPRATWFFWNLLIAAIALVLLAGNAVLFLVAWEVMTIASFFLVTTEDERLEVRRAGWIYLIAAHIGTAFLMVFFLLAGGSAGSLDFAALGGHALVAPGLLFALALVGFGAKAGLVPLHVWLPEAHPAAPSHVSALMSGVLIATGMYGILRALVLAGPLAPAWGPALIVIGALSGLVGVVFALAQDDMKRALAYSSVENMGIALLGIGAGVTGLSRGSPVLAEIGFGAALLHVLNHACFKGLLFLGAGAVRQATGQTGIDRLGGLLRRMPRTGLAFLVGCAAITGLPPLNGFSSEFLTFLAGLRIVRDMPPGTRWAGIILVCALAAVSGLAVALFAKLFGSAFLGTPRSAAAAQAREAHVDLRTPLLILAAACVLLGLFPIVGVRAAAGAVGRLAGRPLDTRTATLLLSTRLLGNAVLGLSALLALCAGLRWSLVRRRERQISVTWGCGYAGTVERAQYSASSLVAPLVAFLGGVLPSETTRVAPPHGLFPDTATLHAGAADVFTQRMYGPSFQWLSRSFRRLRIVQHGRLHWYLLYVFLTLLLMLLIEFGQW